MRTAAITISMAAVGFALVCGCTNVPPSPTSALDTASIQQNRPAMERAPANGADVNELLEGQAARQQDAEERQTPSGALDE